MRGGSLQFIVDFVAFPKANSQSYFLGYGPCGQLQRNKFSILRSLNKINLSMCFQRFTRHKYLSSFRLHNLSTQNQAIFGFS